MRELEEKRVVVLPVLIEDCEIPLFLRDKLYADFRSDFDKGIQQVLESVARVTNDSLGRIEQPEFFVDWAVDWGYVDGYLRLRYTMLEQAKDQPFSVLTEVVVDANEGATRRYKQYEEAGLDWVGRQVVFEALGASGEQDFFMILDDQFPQVKQFHAPVQGTTLAYTITITCRRFGEDTGKSVLLNIRARLEAIRESQRSTLRTTTPEETAVLLKIVTSPFPS